MYAVIRASGKQYKVSPGDILRLPLLHGEVGSVVEFSDILHLADGDTQHPAGSAGLATAKVAGKVLRQGRDKKILVYKFKRRQGYEKRRGHRQDLTEIRIESITPGA